MNQPGYKIGLSLIAILWVTAVCPLAYGQQAQVNTLLGNIAVELKDSLNYPSSDGWQKRYDAARYVIRLRLPRALEAGGCIGDEPVRRFAQELESTVQQGRLATSQDDLELRRSELASIEQEFNMLGRRCAAAAPPVQPAPVVQQAPPPPAPVQPAPVYEPVSPAPVVRRPAPVYVAAPQAQDSGDDVDDELVEELYSESFVQPAQIMSSISAGMGFDPMPEDDGGGMSISLGGGLGSIFIGASLLGGGGLGILGGGGVDPQTVKDLIASETMKVQSGLLGSQINTLQNQISNCLSKGNCTPTHLQGLLSDLGTAKNEKNYIDNQLDTLKKHMSPELQKMKDQDAKKLLKDKRNQDTVKNVLNADKKDAKNKIKEDIRKDKSLKSAADAWKKTKDSGTKNDLKNQLKNSQNTKQQADIRRQLGKETDPGKKAQLQDRLKSLENTNKLNKLGNDLRKEKNPVQQSLLKNQVRDLVRSGGTTTTTPPAGTGGAGKLGQGPGKLTSPSGSGTTRLSGLTPTSPTRRGGQGLTPVGTSTNQGNKLASLPRSGSSSKLPANTGLQPTKRTTTNPLGTSTTNPNYLKRNNGPVPTLSSTQPVKQSNVQGQGGKLQIGTTKPPKTTKPPTKVASVRNTTSSSNTAQSKIKRRTESTHQSNTKYKPEKTTSSSSTRRNSSSKMSSAVTQPTKMHSPMKTSSPSLTRTTRASSGGGFGGHSGGGHRGGRR
jgi:hypothetical protein